MQVWRGWPRSFGTKITLLTTLISAIAIVSVSLTLAALHYSSVREKTLASLQAQAHIVAMNSAAPLAFGDAASAGEALGAFASLPAVESATLTEADTGKPFARYDRRGAAGRRETLSLFVEPSHTERAVVEQKGQKLGTLEVVYDMSELRDSLASSLELSLAVAAIAVLLVLLTTLRARRVLLEPISALRRTAAEVSRTKDYAHRVPKISDDEIGEFADAFNQMLEQIQAQDQAIQESREAALRANQLKDDFLATLSPELRTPMAPIIGWAQILKLSAGDAAKATQAAVVIERNARAQNKIIEDLLDMSRIVSGKIKLDLHTLDLADVVDSAVDVVAASAATKAVHLTKHVPRGTGLLRGDPHRLEQIVWNLLTNAIKFTPEGGSVDIELLRQAGYVELVVADSGQGIAPEFLRHIFERFRQADSTSVRQYGGLGLGLAIAKQLVELHGGTITAHSDGPGKGACFSVRLPIVTHALTPAVDTGEVKLADAAVLLHGLRVLVVDDEGDTREVLREMLSGFGATVRTCESARCALAALSEFVPDVLLSDIAMPEMDGYDLIRAIRNDGAAFRQMPAIALTAFAREEDREKALTAGFQDHVGKPVENAVLVEVVGRAAARAIRPPA